MFAHFGGVLACIGPEASNVGKAIQPMATARKQLLVAYGTTTAALSNKKYFVRTTWNAKDQWQMMIAMSQYVQAICTAFSLISTVFMLVFDCSFAHELGSKA